MKTYDSATLARLAAGEIDVIDGLTLVLDAGTVSFATNLQGSFTFTDDALGTQTFAGAAGLLSLDVPQAAVGAQSEAITASLTETWVPEGTDIPVNLFDDGVRASIDDEPWQNRLAILSVFWREQGGDIIEREQVAIRQIDQMVMTWDANGNPVRQGMLEEPDIIQKDIEGKTSNPAFQALIDPTDKGLEHVAAAATDKIYFGQAADASAGGTSK